MSKAKKTAATHHNIDLNHPQYYFNRELSWLEFNNRVLHEAIDPRTPLLERLKFMGIFSANFDEYFMVRVAALKQQVEAKVSQLTPDGRTPSDQLEEISLAARPLVAQQHQHFEKALRPLMTAQGIHLLDYVDLNQEQRAYLQNYFEEQIFPVLTPLAVDPSHPFPYMSNLSLNLAVVVKDPDTGEELFARVKVPKVLPRFLPLRLESGLGSRSSGLEEERFRNERLIWMGVPLEQVIAHNLESLFPGMNIQEYHPFRITRNADLEVEEDEADDLMLAIEQELRKRRVGGSAVRMEIQASMPESMKGMLMRELGLLERDVYEVDGLLGLADLMYFMQLPLPELKDPVWTPGIPPRLRRLSEGDLDEGEDIFSVIRTADLMVHHPYQSFGGTVQRFITQAAIDPNVLAIKMTLYRTSGDSPILNALITAAEHGKQVAVLVELKADRKSVV